MTARQSTPQGGTMFGRAIRSSAWIAIGYAASQVLRLGANLVLTRLLFPEAFGLMAIVTVFMVGLALFSDVGIGPAISQSRRGDDPDFLNTAWTIQVGRGFGLWLASAALAWPVAEFYGEPQILWLLPVAGSALAVAGFEPTRIETAHRHLVMGRVTGLDLLSQVVGILAMIVFAAILQSVAALVIGNLIGALARLFLMTWGLPGAHNRPRWDREAAHELIRFGKWIFASTLCSFFATQGDKAILGKALTMSMLGIYNIGFFLASFPVLLGQAVTGRVLIPIYREQAAIDPRRLRSMRFWLTAGLMSMLLLLAFVGVPLVDFLYDERYATSGGIVVAVACGQLPLILGMSYGHAALAAGDSRGYFAVSLARAVFQTGFLLVGAVVGGLGGALLGMGLSGIVVHGFIIRLARRHGVWDPVHDAIFSVYAVALGALALWLNWGLLAGL